MSNRDPLDNLRDLIDDPVMPRDAFADELRARLMRDLSASDHSREEQNTPMDATLAPRPPLAFPLETPRRIRPMVILELAAAAIVILGLAAALSRGWFQGDPETPTSVPAAVLQGDSTATPETEPTSTPLPTIAADTTTPPTVVNDQTPTVSPDGMLEPTVVPPGNIPNTIWAIPFPEGESMDFGGLLVDDDVVYRLLATPSFVGVQAVDGETGAIRWQQAHRWAGNLFAIEDGVLYLDGGGNTLTAVDAATGAELWRVPVDGNPIAIAEDDDQVYLLLDTDFVTALDVATGDQRWVAQGHVPQNPTGGSTSLPAIGKIAVENNVVAAVSTYGVLSGFDAVTGQELWAIEGYDAAMTTIQTEGDLFVVSAGAVAFGMGVDGAESGASAGGSSSAASGGTVESSAAAEVSAQGSAGAEACAAQFTPGSAAASPITVDGTPQAGASAAITSNFRVQGIDPATGAILWEQQAVSGGVSDGAQQGAPAEAALVCVVDPKQGTVSGQAIAGSSSASGEIDDDDDGQIAIGVVTGDEFIPGSVAIAGGSSSSLASVPDGEQAIMAVVSDDGYAFVQLADGTLVKVDAAPKAGHENAHSDDAHDDDSDDSTPESDDD